MIILLCDRFWLLSLEWNYILLKNNLHVSVLMISMILISVTLFCFNFLLT